MLGDVLRLAERMPCADGGSSRWRGCLAACAVALDGRGRLASVALAITLGWSVPAAAQSGVLPPTNSNPPTISGTARDESTLTSTDGTWSGVLNAFTRQWQRCDGAGAGCVVIAGATQVSYLLTPSDVGLTIRVRVTASSVLGSDSATSAPTAVVAPALPVNTVLASVSGEARDTQTLSVSPGQWSGTPPLSFGYRWRRCAATWRARRASTSLRRPWRRMS